MKTKKIAIALLVITSIFGIIFLYFLTSSNYRTSRIGNLIACKMGHIDNCSYEEQANTPEQNVPENNIINNKMNTIEGKILFPSEVEIPSGFDVCMDDKDGNLYCTKMNEDLSYKLEVPEGKYYLFSEATIEGIETVAYYIPCDYQETDQCYYYLGISLDEECCEIEECKNIYSPKLIILDDNELTLKNMNIQHGWYLPTPSYKNVSDSSHDIWSNYFAQPVW